jgi:hypothetical protein
MIITTSRAIKAMSRDVAGRGGTNQIQQSKNAEQLKKITKFDMHCHFSEPLIRDQADPWLVFEIWGWRVVAALFGFDVLRIAMCHFCNAWMSGTSANSVAQMDPNTLLLLAFSMRIILLLKNQRALASEKDSEKKEGGNP